MGSVISFFMADKCIFDHCLNIVHALYLTLALFSWNVFSEYCNWEFWNHRNLRLNLVKVTSLGSLDKLLTSVSLSFLINEFG